METGMMWNMSDAKVPDLVDEILVAKAYYSEKYKITPDACQLHPADVPADKSAYKALVMGLFEIGITLSTSRSILKRCLWIGTDNDKPQEKPSTKWKEVSI